MQKSQGSILDKGGQGRLDDGWTGWRLAVCGQIKVSVEGLSLGSSALTLQDRRGRAAAAGQLTGSAPLIIGHAL